MAIVPTAPKISIRETASLYTVRFMSDDATDGEVTQLIERWLSLDAKGLRIPIEELCRDRPELVTVVTSELSAIRNFDALQFADSNPDSQANELGRRDGQTVSTTAYELKQLLGYGGCSEVYLAVDKELGRTVAVKFLRPDAEQSGTLKQRLKREAEITSRLNHPSIVAVHTFGCDGDAPFYSMPYIKGDSLLKKIREFHSSDQSIQSRGTLATDLRRLLSHFIDVCRAVACAHDNNIVHRDIKPANIVTGQFGETYLIDWGLAKSVTDTDKDESDPRQFTENELTQLGHSLGTPAYMSPEQVSGKSIGPCSDIFNLGATLYCLLTGKPPYASESISENIRRAAKASFELPRNINKSIPQPLSAICVKAMALDPDSRYACATELASDIENVMADLPCTAMPEPLSDRVRRWLMRNRTIVTTLATSAMIAVTLLVIGNSLLLNSNRKLVKSEATANHRLYSQLIALANSEIENNNIGRAEQILNQCPEYYRQWEWRLLNSLIQLHRPMQLLEFPGDQVRTLVVSPDGNQVAAGDYSGNIRIWQVDVWDEPKLLDAKMEIRQMAFVPGKNQLLVVGARRFRGGSRIRRLDIESGEILDVEKKNSQKITALAFSDDGETLAVAEFTNRSRGAIKILDPNSLKTKSKNDSVHEDVINDIVFDRSTNSFITCGADGRMARWNFDGKALESFQASSKSLMTIDLQGSKLVASGADSVIRIWDFNPEKEDTIEKYRPVQSFAGHNDHVLTGVIGPDEQIVITGGLDRDIKIWSLKNGSLLRTIQRHTSHVRCLAMHPNRPLLFSAGEDRVIGVWKMEDWLLDAPIGSDAQFGGPNDELYIQHGNEISVLDSRSQKPITRIQNHPNRISTMAVNRRFVATGYFDGRCRIWDAASGNLVTESGNPEHKAIYAMAWATDNQICLAHHRSIIEIVDVSDPESSIEIETEGRPFRVAFVPACNLIAVGTRKGAIELYDLKTTKRMGTLGSNESILDMAASPVAKLLATANAAGEIEVWDLDSMELAHSMESGASWLNCLDFTPDGNRIVSGNEHTLTCWDPKSGKQVLSLTLNRCAHNISFNRDGTKLTFASVPRDGVSKFADPPAIRFLRAEFQ